MVKGASVGMGLKSMYSDLGISVKIDVLTDSSAAKGTASRKGLGKVRHIETNQLWIQEKVSNGTIKLHKVLGTDNIADALTKYVPQEELKWHMHKVESVISEGRHEIAPKTDELETSANHDMKEEDEEEEQGEY